jgi:hypothetical protein
MSIRIREVRCRGLGSGVATARRCEMRAPRSWPIRIKSRVVVVGWREKVEIRASRMERPMWRLECWFGEGRVDTP